MLGCTVGVIRRADEILFFKNRDLDPDYWGLRKLHLNPAGVIFSLSGVNLGSAEPQGASIGLNRCGVCVANTHVVSTPDVTYDVLCLELLQGARVREDVEQIVQGFMARHTVQGGRVLVASRAWTYLVEVYRDQHRIQELSGDAVITNTFSLIPDHVEQPEARVRSSKVRLVTARRMLAKVRRLDDLKAMLRSHAPEKGDDSICNHRPNGGGTESSHIIQIRSQSTRWWHLEGFPCEDEYQAELLMEPGDDATMAIADER